MKVLQHILTQQNYSQRGDSNFLENHRLGVTWSHSRVFGDKGNFKIRLFLQLGLAWVCSGVTQVCTGVRTRAPGCAGSTWVHSGALGCAAGLGCTLGVIEHTAGCTRVYELSGIVQHYAPPKQNFVSIMRSFSLCRLWCAYAHMGVLKCGGCALVHLDAPRCNFLLGCGAPKYSVGGAHKNGLFS